MSSKFLVSQLQPAVLDANVLYPAPMRDLLMT
jgi:hypothetical protein